MATEGFLSLELRVQFCLLVSCTYPSLLTVNKEKNRTDQRASLGVDTRETQRILNTHQEHVSRVTTKRCDKRAWGRDQPEYAVSSFDPLEARPWI